MVLSRNVREGRITYTINNKRGFINPCQLNEEAVNKCIEFAYDMSFGALGEHRASRTGGRNVRRNGEIFCDALNGKLGEFAIHQYFAQHNIHLPEPDLTVYGLGQWDDTDFLYNGHYIAVKTTKHIGNLLLLEQDDWDENGYYIPNSDSPSHGRYHAVILVRISSDSVDRLKKSRKYYSDELSEGELKAILSNFACSFDIPGYVDLDLLKEIINNNQIIEQGSYLGEHTLMDATNYYVQTGDLISINHLVGYLRGIDNPIN